MKKINLLFFCLVFFSTISSVFGQGNFPENEPCSSVCLPMTGLISGASPFPDGVSPNVNLPCGEQTSEDNPTWFKFVPNSNSMTFIVTASNCAGGSGSSQFTVFEGDDCGSLSAIGCLNCVLSGEFTVATKPFQTYYMQVDGCAEALCDFSVSYSPSSIVNPNAAPQTPTLTIPQSCKGETTCYKFTLNNTTIMEDITISPSNAAIVPKVLNPDGILCILWQKAGNIKLCGNVKLTNCNQTQVKNVCYDLVVKNPTDTTNFPEPTVWEQRGVPSHNFEKIIFDPSRANTFYTLTAGKLLLSKNNGATFEPVKNNYNIRDFQPTIDSNIIYMQSASNVTYRTDNGGKTWTILQIPDVQLYKYKIFVNPNKPNIVIFHNNNNPYGHYCSKDKGQTFAYVGLPEVTPKFNVAYGTDKYFFINELTSKVFLTSDFISYNQGTLSSPSAIDFKSIKSVRTPNSVRYYAVANNNDIMTLSPETGNIWSKTANVGTINALYTAPFGNPNEVYADVQSMPNTSIHLFWKSVDMGKTWKSIFNLGIKNQNVKTGWIGSGGVVAHDKYAAQIAVNPSASNKVILFHNKYFDFVSDAYFSSDSGENMEQIYVNKSNENLAGNLSDRNKEYEHNGAVTGFPFAPVPENQQNAILSMADKNTIFASFWKSTNDGKSWRANPDSLVGDVSTIVKNPTNNLIFMTSPTGSQKIVYSDNDGTTWKLLRYFPITSLAGLALHPKNPKTMYLVEDNKIWKTEDLDKLEKATWKIHYSLPKVINKAFYMSDINVLGDSSLLFSVNGMVDSTSYNYILGKSYYIKESGKPTARKIDFALFSQLVIDPSDASEKTFYAVTSASDPKYDYSVVVSKDRGITWRSINNADIVAPTSIAVNPLRPNQVFVGTKNGIWVSDNVNDACARWKKLKNYDFNNVLELKFNTYEKDELWAISRYNGIHKAKVPNLLLFANATANNKIDCKNLTTQIKVSPTSYTFPNSPLTYVWTGANNLTSNLQEVTVSPSVTSKYFVTVTNAAGQKAVDSVTVFVDKTPPTVTVKTTPANATVCSGQNVQIDALSASSNFIWSNGIANQNTITVATGGKYIVTVTGANSCTNTAFADVNISPALQKATQVFFIVPASKTLKVSLLAIVQAANSSVKSVTPAFVSIKENPGVYLKKYTYTDQNGCSGEVELNVVVVNKVKKPVLKTSKNNPIQLDENLASKLAKEGISLDEITFDAPILVFPNPSDGVFNLAFADETLDFSAEIFDMAGKKVFSAQNQTKIDLSSQAKGTYLLKVYTKEEFFTQVLILQ